MRSLVQQRHVQVASRAPLALRDVLEPRGHEHEGALAVGEGADHARSAAYLSIDESPEAEQHLWHVRQVFLDENADGDFRIEADVNLDATQEEGEVIFKNYRVGFVEDLAE